MDQLQVAVVTGQHTFDVPAFYALLWGMPGVAFYPQDLENFVADVGHARAQYDAVVFYNYHKGIPGEDVKSVLERLGERAQGIVLLHHGLVAFLPWGHWSELCGIRDRTFTAHTGQSIHVQVAHAAHPITRGLAAWDMVDETYTMHSVGAGSEILLTVAHPRSMRTIAWTRAHGRARVFCYQSGHDRQAYKDPNFRVVLARGIEWVARKI